MDTDARAMQRAKRFHLIGAKGAGMTALAELLVKRGKIVTGSDTPEVFYTDAVLARIGVPVRESFTAAELPADADIIVYSTAYNEANNPELAAALSGRAPVLSYPEAVGLLTQGEKTLAVCGTHGKTTTSALLAETLRFLGKDPSAIVGSMIEQWGGCALSGEGEYLVLEADEYQDKLRFYQPYGVILTSADWDHPDFFPDETSYVNTFERFVSKIPRIGALAYCSDSTAVITIAQQAPGAKISYGRIAGADVLVTDFTPLVPESGNNGYHSRFSLQTADTTYGPFTMRLAGIHNAVNAAGVLALFLALRLPTEGLVEAFAEFPGTKRRFELVGERFGAFVYDDYAHHPEEIRVTLKAFRELYPEKTLKVIFHPHTFTRTRALFADFAQCFDVADEVHVLDIYGSARETQGGVSSQELVDEINRFTPGKAEHAPDRTELTQRLMQSMGKSDIIITMGAGDVWKIGAVLLQK